MRRGVSRLLHVDDPSRLEAYSRLLSDDHDAPFASLSDLDRRYARMLSAQIGDQVFTKDDSPEDGWRLLRSHPQVCADAAELLRVLREQVDHLHPALTEHPDVPLVVHARYTRIEMLAAFGDGESAKVAAWQTGVRFLKDARADLFAFTLDKSTGGFSPTTRYKDYAISRELVHWESQGITREASETGLRYQRHADLETSILLFARLRSDDRAFWFLGPATYVDHVGEKPMAITWRLKHPLPGDLYGQFAAAVA